MAFPSHVGAGTPVESTTTATPAPHASHATGDYELLICETADEAVTLTTAAGFTEHPGSPVSTGGGVTLLDTRLTVFERIWNGTDGSPTTNDPGNHIWCLVDSFRRSTGTWSTLADARSATSGTGWASNFEAVEDTTGSFPAITADTVDQRIVGITAHAKPDIAGGLTEMSAITNAGLANIGEILDDACASGNGGWLGIFTAQRVAVGDIGVTTYTKATTSYKTHLIIGLRDSAPGAAAVGPPLERRLPQNAMMNSGPWGLGGWS
jgi:hypothetical protein